MGGICMAFFSWDEKFATNIHAFDEDHKHLICLFNDIYDKVFKCENIDDERELTQETLTNLLEYIHYHFTAEEKLMKDLGYPGYTEHKQQHDYYISAVNKMVIEHTEGGVALSFTVFMLLKDWITTHILGADKEYMQFFKDKGIK